MPLHESVEDRSAYEQEKEAYTSDQNSEQLIHSVYKNDPLSTVSNTPIQLISSKGHLYIFRQTVNKTLLVQRFVLDGMNNNLVPKLDVRFRRSKQKHKAHNMLKKRGGKGLDSADSLGFKDMNDNFFYEPATELRFINNLHEGWFSALLLPTQDQDVECWNIFVYDNKIKKIRLYTIRASEQGLFDIQDRLVKEADPQNPDQLVYRSIPGIINRTLELEDMQIAHGCSATTYYRQVEIQTEKGPRMLKEAARVMLAVPVKARGSETVTTATVSFAIAHDGTLSQIDLAPDNTDLHKATIDELLLPLDTMDDVKVIADTTPPPSGTIQAMSRTENDKLKIVSRESLAVSNGDTVQIRETEHYNGLYKVKAVEGDTFEIEAEFSYDEPGFWEVIPEKETGLIFDDMVTGYEKTDDNRLKVICTTHTLEVGDEVQVTGLKDYNGYYAVSGIDSEERSFIVDVPWKPGEAVDLKSVKRRGVYFDGEADYLRAYELALDKPQKMVDFGRTISAWVRVDSKHENRKQILIREQNDLISLRINENNQVELHVHLSDGSDRIITAPDALALDQWIHYAGTLNYDTQKGGCYTLSLYCEGDLVANLEETGLSLQESNPGSPEEELPPASFLQFDGVRDHITLPDITADFSEGITIEVWVKYDEFKKYGRIIDIGNGATDTIYLCNNFTSNTLAFTIVGSKKSVITASGALELGVWTHLAATVDSNGSAKLYKNGEEIASKAMSVPASVTRQNNCIARHNINADNFFAGSITDLRIWNRSRSQDGIQSSMQTRLIGSEANLVGYWPLNEVVKSSGIADKSPSALDGILHNDPEIIATTTPISNLDKTVQPVRQFLQFDGTSDYIEVPYQHAFSADNFSISCWVKATGGAGTFRSPVTCRDDHPQRGFMFYATPGNQWAFWMGTGHDWRSIQGPQIIEGQWTHLAAAYNGTTMQLFVNGDKSGEINATLSPNTTRPLRIGAGTTEQSAALHFPGHIAEVRLYHIARTIDDIRHDMLPAVDRQRVRIVSVLGIGWW